MAEKIHLTKEYERDVSLVVEGLWAQKLALSVVDHLKLELPYKPMSVFYATGENLQTWENEKAIQWYRDRLLEENRKGPEFIKKIISNYEVLLEQIEVYWKNGPITDVSKLIAYKKLVEKASELFSLWYYPVSDDRTPQNVKDLLVDLRTDDAFFGRNDVFIKGCAGLRGVKPESAGLIFPEEFPNIPDNKILEKRSRGTVLVDGTDNIVISLKEFASKHPEYIFEGLFDSVSSAKEVRGQSAYKGRATGKVRVIKNKIQMKDMQKGEILVSPMTTPDFLPAMKKASAFVTDEGGIVCHAAIVAREMKKPCIVGTKIATKVFKDGDMVEVDAEKGIVRILK